jgi:light-regulated signal transduction histidine kinase (bacteriophytochrome)
MDVRLQVLLENSEELEKAARVLQRSYRKCQNITVPFSVDDDEKLETIEALTARFARATDLVTQRMSKSLIMVLREDARTLIDRLNVMEKVGATQSARVLVEIRDIRNEIAHEYTSEGIQKMFEACMPLVPELLQAIEMIVTYARTRSVE